MTFSILTVLVIVESLVIIIFILAYYIRRSFKLKKRIDDLLRKLSESIFSKLLQIEIDKTIEHITQIEFPEDDALELAENEEPEQSPEDELKRLLTFRSSYLHAEIDADQSSAGNPDLFWPILAENLSSLLPLPFVTEENEGLAESNEYIDEIMQELQNKLDKATESNLSLQALLDSLLADGHLPADQIQVIKNSQADFHDLNQHVSDLENKIQNSLNIEIITTNNKDKKSTLENTLVVEKASHVVNTEVNKLKDVIYEQGNKINALLKSLKDGSHDVDISDELSQHLNDLEKSQKETSMCLEVLEMENSRLMDEIDSLRETSVPSIDGVEMDEMDSDQLKVKIHDLEKELDDKAKENQKLHDELNSVEKEFMAVYEKGAEENIP